VVVSSGRFDNLTERLNVSRAKGIEEEMVEVTAPETLTTVAALALSAGNMVAPMISRPSTEAVRKRRVTYQE
jgi:hypothetical protein